MNLRANVGKLKQNLAPILLVAAVIALCAAVIWFVPARLAALVLGISAAALFYYVVVVGLQRTTQIAMLWAGLAITADAAYAKLNDQAPVTIVSAAAKVVEGLVKLGDGLIRATTLPTGEARTKLATFAPDFLWALILALLLLMVVNSMAKR